VILRIEDVMKRGENASSENVTKSAEYFHGRLPEYFTGKTTASWENLMDDDREFEKTGTTKLINYVCTW
jgi:hypothetical protein